MDRFLTGFFRLEGHIVVKVSEDGKAGETVEVEEGNHELLEVFDQSGRRYYPDSEEWETVEIEIGI